MVQNSTLVMKFGGAAVETLSHFAHVADIIQSRAKEYSSVVVVVSAMQGTTDRLIGYAREVNPNPPQREYDMLISVGERISCSLLAMALAAKSVPAVSFTGSQAGIVTTEEHTEAKIVDVRPFRLKPFIQMGNVIIVAGFQGVSQGGAITTLGRGGSDTTAVALGIALGAGRVEFYKDVDGIYTQDPKKQQNAEHLPVLEYRQAVALIEKTGKILHPRCVLLAEKNQVELHIASFHQWNDPSGLRTIIRGCGQKPLEPVYELNRTSPEKVGV